MTKCLLILASLILIVGSVLVTPLQAETATGAERSSATLQASLSEWSVLLTASTANEGANSRLAFGTRSGATNGLDYGVDDVHPPAGPGSTFDSYFMVDHALFPQLDKDFRGLESGNVWRLDVKSNGGVTLTWNSAGVPAGMNAVLSGSGLSVNMLAESSVVVPAGIHHLSIAVSSLPGSAGDANEDGFVNMGDVTKVELIILGLADRTAGADASGDGQVNMGDVTKIELIILGLA